MTALAAPAAADRSLLYRQLARRNRIVAVLRLLVPLTGVVLAVLVVLQIQVASVGREYGITSVKVTGDSVAVETPRYSGTLEDGTRYDVTAAAASASTSSQVIELTDAVIRLMPANGTDMTVRAKQAQFDTGKLSLFIGGTARLANAAGVEGTAERLTLDWTRLTYQAEGDVHFEYPNGTTLDSVGMKYDPLKDVWTFSGATMTLPSTPDQEAAAAAAQGDPP